MNIEYYTKKSNNIVNQSIALEYGRVGTEVNGGRVVNSGVEYTLNITPIRTKDWPGQLDLTHRRTGIKLRLNPSAKSVYKTTFPVPQTRY